MLGYQSEGASVFKDSFFFELSKSLALDELRLLGYCLAIAKADCCANKVEIPSNDICAFYGDEVFKDNSGIARTIKGFEAKLEIFCSRNQYSPFFLITSSYAHVIFLVPHRYSGEPVVSYPLEILRRFTSDASLKLFECLQCCGRKGEWRVLREELLEALGQATDLNWGFFKKKVLAPALENVINILGLELRYQEAGDYVTFNYASRASFNQFTARNHNGGREGQEEDVYINRYIEFESALLKESSIERLANMCRVDGAEYKKWLEALIEVDREGLDAAVSQKKIISELRTENESLKQTIEVLLAEQTARNI